MKRIGAFLLGLLTLLCLCACTPAPAPQTAEPGPLSTDKAAPETASPGADPAGGEDPVEQLLSDGEALLLAARRATAQAFDKLWYDCPCDDARLKEYYWTGVCSADSALLQRSKALAAARADPDRVKQEDGKVLYRTSLPRDGEWVDQWVELDLEAHDRPAKTVTEGFITAELKDDRVFLSFADTEEANYYLRGWDSPDYDYQWGERPYALPGDTLPVGPGHRYEVEGLFSRYKDLFVGSPYGYEYQPYLFLVTEDNALEMVDITSCFQYGVFCAMPLPGHFEEASLSAPVMQDRYGDHAVIITDRGGEVCDLFRYAINANYAVPRGGWSGSIGEIAGSGGSWSRIADLVFETSGSVAWGGFAITELDAEVEGGDMDVTTLGMTAEGVVTAFQWNTWAGEGSDYWWEGADCGAMVWTSGAEDTGSGTEEVIYMKQLTGASPLCGLGETVKLYRSEFGTSSGLNEVVAAFEGEWLDTVSGRCHLSVITSGPADEIHIRVEWGDSAAESYVWTMTGIPGEYEVALSYDDCTCRIVEYSEYGAEIVKDTLYTGGRGGLVQAEPGVLFWTDEGFERSRECRFVPVSAEDG